MAEGEKVGRYPQFTGCAPLRHWWCGTCKLMGTDGFKDGAGKCTKCGGQAEVSAPLERTV